MKWRLIVGLLTGLSCLALMHFTAASNVSIKFGEATNEFVIQESNPMLTLPSYIKVQGTKYALDFSRKPDLKDCSSIIISPDAGVIRYDVTGSLEFRPEKNDKSNSTKVPVIVVRKLSPKLTPSSTDATLETQHYFSRR